MNWGARGMERNTLEGDGHPTLWGLAGAFCGGSTVDSSLDVERALGPLRF